ncbi:MAG: helix-turn-helix domain-containing protein [Bacilli bacterium]|nr:helix-turn-helix domain-containing protein [Bacilli bacterium]
MENLHDESFLLLQLGARIKFLRKEKKLSQLDLALEAGVAKNYISDLENGRRNPSVLILNRICIALNIQLEDLFKGVSDLNYLL